MSDFKAEMQTIRFKPGLCLRSGLGAYNAPSGPLL